MVRPSLIALTALCGLGLILALPGCAAPEVGATPVGAVETLQVVPLEYAVADELAVIMTQLEPKHGALIVADARRNALVVSGTPEAVARAKEIIAGLDQPA